MIEHFKRQFDWISGPPHDRFSEPAHALRIVCTLLLTGELNHAPHPHESPSIRRTSTKEDGIGSVQLTCYNHWPRNDARIFVSTLQHYFYFEKRRK